MPRVGGALDIVQTSDPATPASGRQFLYFKSDGLLYTKKSDGSVSQVGGAAGAPANMLTTDTAQVLTTAGVKTFPPGTLLMRNAGATATAEPYSDVNPPATLNLTDIAQTSVTNPPAGQASLYTPDGMSVRLRDQSGTDTLIGPSAGGASATPGWAGVIHAAAGSGEPEWEWQWNNLWGTGTTALTPTGVTATVGRIWSYRSPYAITLRRLRWFAVAGTAAASNFRFGIYNAATGAQVLAPQTLTFTGTDRWTSIPINGTTGIVLAADTPYYCCLSATATATTWSLKASGLPVTYPHLPGANSPDNFEFPGVNANKMWFGQIAVSAGVQPATLPALARGAAWGVGGLPAFLFGSSATA